jgi:hypothetical protein
MTPRRLQRHRRRRRRAVVLLVLLALPALSAAVWLYRHSLHIPTPRAAIVTVPPAELGLDPFYAKYLNPGGDIPVISSAKVPDAALLVAVDVIDDMLAARPDLRAALARGNARVAVMARTEHTTDIPEHSWFVPASYWDRRARGIGGHWLMPTTTCAEENLLGHTDDPYCGESILVHELAHAVHHIGLHALDPTFDGRLRRTYRHALAKARWGKTYAATNASEYWAEGVQSYFDANAPSEQPGNSSYPVGTRDALQVYDPELFALIEEVFAGNPWRWTANGAHERWWR